MTETLISSLSQLPNLSVKARSSVFRYKGKAIEARTIAKELNVQAILNGRVVQHGDQITLSLELVDAQTENIIWSEQYNCRQTDLVSLQNEIARDVSSKLKTKLSGADEQKLAKTDTVNPEAYRLHLQGRFFLDRTTREDTAKAIEYFRQALDLDPGYALCWAELGRAYAVEAGRAWVPEGEGFESISSGNEAGAIARSGSGGGACTTRQDSSNPRPGPARGGSLVSTGAGSGANEFVGAGRRRCALLQTGPVRRSCRAQPPRSGSGSVEFCFVAEPWLNVPCGRAAR